jgi:hypothetical protein
MEGWTCLTSKVCDPYIIDRIDIKIKYIHNVLNYNPTIA